MGYVGPAPGSLWIWRPSQSSLGEEWHTLVSEFESGAEQRRSKWAASRATLRFQFDRGALTPDDVADIWRFWQRQQGRFTPILVPTFGRVTDLASAYSVGSLALGLSQTQDLTTAAASHWNRLCIDDQSDNLDFVRVGSVVNATRIELTVSGSYAHVAGSAVYPVLRARFTDDAYSPEYLVALMTTVGIGFTEVRS